MNDSASTTARPQPGDPRPTHSPPLLAGFWPMFMWGLRSAFRPQRFLLALILAGGLGVLIGMTSIPEGPFTSDDTRYFWLWKLIDDMAIRYLVPLAALLCVTSGFSREVSQRTLVYHLVRPVSRSTLYLARYCSGLVPGTLAALVTLLATVFATGVDIPASVWLALPLAAVLGVMTLGALYYLLATLFRMGIIAGLIYTFVIEVGLGHARGAMQKVSMTYHLRSLVRGIVNDDFTTRSNQVVESLQPKVEGATAAERLENSLTMLAKVEYETPTTAAIVMICLTVALLAVGIWRISKRDFALKD